MNKNGNHVNAILKIQTPSGNGYNNTKTISLRKRILYLILNIFDIPIEQGDTLSSLDKKINKVISFHNDLTQLLESDDSHQKRKLYLSLARIHHSNKGGNNKQFQLLQGIYESNVSTMTKFKKELHYEHVINKAIERLKNINMNKSQQNIVKKYLLSKKNLK